MGTSPSPAAAGPRTRPGTHVALFAAVAIGWLVLDQASKAWAVSRLGDGDVIDVAWTLRFNLAYNSGASFSMGRGNGRWIAVARGDIDELDASIYVVSADGKREQRVPLASPAGDPSWAPRP